MRKIKKRRRVRVDIFLVGGSVWSSSSGYKYTKGNTNSDAETRFQ